MAIKNISDIPGWVWFTLGIGGFYLYGVLKDMYDTNQLEQRLVNRKPANYSERCLVNAYHQIKKFESNFELELEARNLEFIDEIRSGELHKNPPSMTGFENIDDWLDSRTQFYEDDLKEVTERSFKYSFMLYGAFREYCITEAACQDDGYDGYKKCMKYGPVWSSNDWEYPIMWSLDES
ncbi:MAG: hypothetical protein ACI8U0_002811 [Flavobacteriales bacterium]|jgi:hypothetical protein